MSQDPQSPQSHDDSPRRRSEGTGKTVQWMGCPLVPYDEAKEAKMIPVDARVGVKIELKGWSATPSNPKCALKRAVPVEIVAHDFTPDALHRLYGQFKWFCQAYTLSATGGLQTPLGSRMLDLQPAEFDDPDFDNDPEDEDDDVGTDPLPPTVDAAKQEDPTLRKELRRRAQIRHEIAQGGGFDDDGDGDEDHGRGGGGSFRERDRTVRGEHGRPVGRPPMMGRPMDDRRSDPEWVFDPNTRPTAPCPPGFMWCFGGNPMKWYHTERTAELVAAAAVPVVAPVAAPVAPREPSFFETAAGAAFITGALGALATIGKAALEPKPAPPPPPDPMAAFAALMAVVNGSKGDPAALKQLEIEAEDRRAAAALAAQNAAAERETARIEAARIAADAQRSHDAAMEEKRREAARLEAIAVDERAAARAVIARNDLIALERMGLTGTKGPTPEQAMAEKQLAVMQAQIQWMQSAPKTPDVMESFEKAKSMLTKLGVKVGDGDDKGGALIDALGTDAAKAMAEGIAPGFNAILMKLAGASPVAAPQGPLPTQVTVQNEDVIRQREQTAYEQGILRARAELAAQQAQQPPASMFSTPPAAMEGFREVAPDAVPEPTSDATIEAPAEQPPVEAEAPVVEVPVAEIAEAAPEVPQEPVAEPLPVVEAPVAEPAPEAPIESMGVVSVIDRDDAVTA